MHTSLRILLALLIGTIAASAAQPPYALNTIVVRFASASVTGSLWTDAGRTGSIEAFVSTLGAHRTYGYVSDATLTAVRKAERERKFSEDILSSLDPLPYIAVIEYDREIDPTVAARKVASHPDVVYAEPLYHQEIIDAPNDPLASSQYHLAVVRATEAWDLLPAGDAVVVGIVDTGIDTLHPDLNENIWRNPGETGVDGSGNDKRSNGVDDDSNGFVDDWIGWDFVGATNEVPDNMPLPGHTHGTHVGGIVAAVVNNNLGIAGVARNVKVVPIKIGLDNVNSRSVLKTSDGILYAAAIGCDVINCSFGSSSASFAGLDIVSAATGLGSLIVGAAGNDGVDRAFYPAAHPPVLSVAATDSDDTRAFFSNVNATVDVSAPGYSILSTIAGDGYDYFDGTSMAAPIVAAIAAMTKIGDPTLSPTDLKALLKANTDNIDLVNQSLIGRMGTGRVNAVATVQRRAQKYAELTSFAIQDADGDGVFTAGETLEITVEVTNLLRPLNQGRVVLSAAPSQFMPVLTVGSTDLGSMRKFERKAGSNSMTLQVPVGVPLNAELSLIATILEGDTVIGRDLITATINPSYRTMSENDLTFSLNSVGNIGYNDYPDNQQGVGFQYRSSGPMLYEGAFMVGTSPGKLPNVARGGDTRFRDDSFSPMSIVEIRRDSVESGIRGVVTFNDSRDSYGLGLAYKQTILQPTADSLRSSAIVVYDITNPADTTVSGIHAGLFFDWDTSPLGADDGVAWDNEHGIGIHQNARRNDVPTVTVSMLSPMKVHFFAMNNGGSVGIYNGFSRTEKWFTMSNGLARRNSTITDVSMVIAGGPFTLIPGETRQIAFAIVVGETLEDATLRSRQARNAAMDMGLNAAPYTEIPLADAFMGLSGGQVQVPGPAVVTFLLQNSSRVTIDLFDVSGRSLGVLYDAPAVPAGEHAETITIPSASTGVYVLRLSTSSGTVTYPIQILP